MSKSDFYQEVAAYAKARAAACERQARDTYDRDLRLMTGGGQMAWEACAEWAEEKAEETER